MSTADVDADWSLTPAFEAVDRTREVLLTVAQAVRADARRRVPVLTGELRDSSRVTMDHNRAIISFDDPKAVIVHEDLNARHARGEAKFLENALSEVQDRLEAALAQGVRL